MPTQVSGKMGATKIRDKIFVGALSVDIFGNGLEKDLRTWR
jgi:hypothetical protein